MFSQLMKFLNGMFYMRNTQPCCHYLCLIVSRKGRSQFVNICFELTFMVEKLVEHPKQKLLSFKFGRY